MEKARFFPAIFLSLILPITGCASTPLQEKMEATVKNGMSEKEVVELLGAPAKRSEKFGAEILEFAYPFKNVNEKTKWYEGKTWAAYFSDGILIHFQEIGFGQGAWESGSLKKTIQQIEQGKAKVKYEEDVRRDRIAAAEHQREAEERMKTEREEKLRKEAEEKKYWEDLEKRILDPQTPADVRKALSAKFELHQEELKAEFQREQVKQEQAKKNQIEARWNSIAGNYQQFHEFRIYAYSVNDQSGNFNYYHYIIYDAGAEQSGVCDGNKCLYEWKTNKLQEMIANPNINEAERQALSLEHQQLVAEYQTQLAADENDASIKRAQARQWIINKMF